MTCPNSTCGQFGPSPTSVGVSVYGPLNLTYTTVISTPAKRPAASGAVQCMQRASPWSAFEERWAENATYAGAFYLRGVLCHAWDGVVPYFVQRVQRISRYYSDYYTGLRVALINAKQEVFYSDVVVGAPDQSMFETGASMKCDQATDALGSTGESAGGGVAWSRSVWV